MSDSILSNLELIPRCTIHPTKICLYKEVHWSPVKCSSKFSMDTENEEISPSESFLKSARKNNGFLSQIAKRKLFKAFDYLLITSDRKKIFSKLQNKYITYRIVFVTLTLPSKQVHTDREITNQLLNQFLIELQKYHNVRKYIWRAEKQANGDIHYHIVINEFVDYQILRKRWNRICNKLGYVDRYQSKMKQFYADGFRLSENINDKRSIDQQRSAYIIGQKSDWTSPNSTDIHDTRKIHDIKKYIGKYMSKQPDVSIDSSEEEIDRLTVDGRLWSCSQNLSNIKGCELVEDWQISDEIEKIVNNSKCHVYHDPYFTVIFIDAIDLLKYGSPLLFRLFSDYLIDQFDYHLQLTA